MLTQSPDSDVHTAGRRMVEKQLALDNLEMMDHRDSGKREIQRLHRRAITQGSKLPDI